MVRLLGSFFYHSKKSFSSISLAYSWWEGFYNNVFFFVGLTTLGTFIELWLVGSLSFQTFQPLIVIYRRVNFVHHLFECTSIYRPLSYALDPWAYWTIFVFLNWIVLHRKSGTIHHFFWWHFLYNKDKNIKMLSSNNEVKIKNVLDVWL